MQRNTVDPVAVREDDRGVRETHPAFGVAVVSRVSSVPGAVLFQSDIRHRETIRLSIKRADRTRDLNHDWVFGHDELIEIEMSLAQWGSLISSQGIGGGVPVTLRRTESEVFVDAIPFRPRIQQNISEVRGSFNKTFAAVQKAFERVEDAFENKKGVKVQREAIRNLKFTIQNIPENATFAVKSLKEAAEHVVSQASADIEAQIIQAQRLTGQQASIEAPDMSSRNAIEEAIANSPDDGEEN